MIADINEAFEKNDDEHLKFARVTERHSNRPDLHAFIMLDKLFPGTADIVSAAEHDNIYLAITPDQLASVATEAQVIDLIRCGVRLDDGSLCMFA